MKLVSNPATVHRRNSVRMLIVGVLVSFIGGIWSALPAAFVARLPVWLVFLISGAVSAVGLLCAYTRQRGFNDD